MPIYRGPTEYISPSSKRALRLALLASFALVHCITATRLGLSSEVMAQSKLKPARTTPVVSPKADSQPPLTPAAADMRDAILEAVHSGRIDDLRHAIELNELKPDFGAAPGADPIQHLKTLSRDNTGTDILAALSALLDSPRKSVPAGKDPENNLIYNWPRFADEPLSKLSTEDTALLERIETPDTLQAMKASDRYTGWQLRIGSDGIWHGFTRLR